MAAVEDVTAETPVSARSMEHFICCDSTPDAAPTLCGSPGKWDDSYAWKVACMVCNDLEAHNVCPTYGECHYKKCRS